MKQHTNGRSFRPPSRDPRQISERSLVCESPPSQFIFAQMTIGLEDCYARIRCEDGSRNISVLENQAIEEEEFSPRPGSMLAGRYKVIAKVGEGQSSVLVKAKDVFHPNGKLVAIKILHASYRNLGPQEASCLLHLRKADMLKVANIAHMLNTFTVGHHFCIVFEFLLPTPLYKYFQMFPFPSKAEKIKLIRRIAFQITQSLAVLSSLNIIHSDIKPENILFTDGVKKDVKLIDFGNAIYCIHDEMSLYFESFELQTVFYRAPEVMFGLPFGPQIDMWSLGCVLAEFYLGEPLFLATSKDEILEKMQALLGPLPMSPFQSGKYFSMFKKFVGRVSSVPGDSKIVVNILKKLGSTDYIFADFLAKLLAFDPSLRLSPTEAARHPFLAPECAMMFMLPPRDLTQEPTYPPILFTPATYPHRPKIDAKIKKLHYSELDLLRVGTQSSTKSKADNVMKVLPFNYQEETPNRNKEENSSVSNKSKPEPRELRNVGKNTEEKIRNNETAGEFGVWMESESHGDRSSMDADRRDNPYNESCCVLRATKDARSICVKGNETYNLVKDSKLLQGSAIRGQKDNTLGANTTNESCSLFSKHIARGNTFDPIESCSGSNTIKDSSFFTTSMKGGLAENDDDETVLNAAKDKRLSILFAKQHERDGPFNESCSVLNTKNSPFSTVDKGKNKKHARKFVLRKSSKTRRRGDSETESGSSVSRKDSTNTRKPYNVQSVSPAKVGNEQNKSPVKFINDNDLVLITAPSTRTTSKDDDRILEDIQKLENKIIEENLTASRTSLAYKESSSETSYKETKTATPLTRRTKKIDGKILENIPKRFSNRKMDEVNIIVSPKDTNKGTWWETSDKKTSQRNVGRQNKTAKPNKNYADESGGQSGSEACASKTKDRPNLSSAVGRRKNMKTQQVVSTGVKDDPQTEATLTHKTRENVSTSGSDYKDHFSVTSSSKQESVDDSCRNVKSSESTQPSYLESFFDGFAEDEINVVSSSTNLGKLRAKTEGISKKNVLSFSKDKNSSFGEEVMPITSSSKQDRRPARKSDNDKNSTTAKRNNELKMVTSSVNQGNGTSLKHIAKPGTPNFQKKESVFDTPIPCNVVGSKRELLPGGLSEVKKTMSRFELKQDNSMYEIHHSFQTQVVGNTVPDKQSLNKFRKTYTSPKERTEKVLLERNSQLIRDGQLKKESQDLKRVSKEKGDRNLAEETGAFYPTDILTQQKVKQARKRKLEYSTVNSPGNTVSCLERSRQTVKVQKIDELSDDSDDNYDVLLL